ncbi:Metallo-dependent hydrolase [Gloeophyllum trabeum ATCC 11539]|uniref:Metallo-dependent hydrolase n=1 Tax=Gloeophyllum trabeum (strain ATCC 11539 / FP-39264 / Madison 617) TaxID=670483 RepID=S7RL88_GLOTA|nr:Metallo-dependent hydrolase [Gloeophyllum trabeum ATCC 11539]EPQ55150.1 Metallo-dependent hydrolase [Gloeophyllum trabeum ATCC 11539]
MTSPNGLICFTNCLLPLEDGSLVERDLWIDERRGIILDSQRTFFLRKERPDRIIDLGGNILSPGLIDIQINGAYGFDFSVYEGDDEAYKEGMKTVALKIVETGVTSLVPTLITQEKSLYPKLLHLLRPFSVPNSANLLGWHAEGPFIQMAKRGAHAPPFIIPAPERLKSFEDVYGAENLVHAEDWMMEDGETDRVGVRIITAAPEIDGVMDTVPELIKRGVVYSIGHSIAKTDTATLAVIQGARLITHLFNAMPLLHHRDPSIIGLLGASPHLSSAFTPLATPVTTRTPGSPVHPVSRGGTLRLHHGGKATSEAFDEHETPPQTPVDRRELAISSETIAQRLSQKGGRPELHLDKGETADMAFERPFYEMIVDGIHSHPNSVRLAYGAYPDGCILITDAMKILDPHLKDGVHEWRDGKRFVKEGDKLYLEGTDTLAGSVVTLDKCVRNFSRFTGCSLGEAIKCATYNPAKCLGIENRKGTLRPGADADLVVLDRKGHVVCTWVKGKEVWTRSGSQVVA